MKTNPSSADISSTFQLARKATFLGLALLATLTGPLALPAHAATPTKQWNQGNPSNDEQYAMEFTNRMRVNPVAESNRILASRTTDPQVLAFIRSFTDWRTIGDDAEVAQIQKRIAAFASLLGNSVYPPLAFYPLFSYFAQRDCLTPQIGSGLLGPLTWDITKPLSSGLLYGTVPNPDGSYAYSWLPNSGISNGAYFYVNTVSGPNATGGTATSNLSIHPFDGNNSILNAAYNTSFAPGQSPPGIQTPYNTVTWSLANALGKPHIALFQTAGSNLGEVVSSTGVSSGVFAPIRCAGISVQTAPAGNPNPTVSQCLSIWFSDNITLKQSDFPYTATNTAFVTGVAYQDLNGNGVYDAGEGVGGVKITLGTGDWFAVTSASGGYSVPVQVGSGSLTVTATGQGFNSTKTVTIGQDNVKADFVTTPIQQITVPASTGNTSLINISTRGYASTGGNALIAGFVISGSAPKPVLIRASGPALIQYGVTGTITGTTLNLFQGGNVIANNTGWSTATNAAAIASGATQVGAFAFATGSGDSAIVVTLQPGAYTAQITPATGAQPGVALVEVYDLAVGNGSNLINISTRGVVSADIPMIAGFVVGGNSTKRAVLRASGPALTDFGLTGTLTNPTLTLNVNGKNTDANSNWALSSTTTQFTALESTVGAFLFKPGNLDSELTESLNPGAYTVLVTSTDGSSGIALVEVYDAK